MDEHRKKLDPTLVCTCSDLYLDDINDAINDGEDDYKEIMQYNDTLPRCGECQCHIEQLVALANLDD